MTDNVNQSVKAFIEYVEETEPEAVAKQFMKELDKCSDPNRANLTLMLKKARVKAPGSTERAKIENSQYNSASYHCNS